MHRVYKALSRMCWPELSRWPHMGVILEIKGNSFEFSKLRE
jgi:hypothetical protein